MGESNFIEIVFRLDLPVSHGSGIPQGLKHLAQGQVK